MSEGRRQFTDEFKREAVALLASSGRPLLQIASELGISPSMLRNWRNRSEGRNAGSALRPIPAPAPHSAPDSASEISRLRRENDRLRMERDILKNLSRGFVPPVAVETGALTWPWRGSGRQLHGGDDPVKKRGPWAVAHLRVVTP
jgi:transposase